MILSLNEYEVRSKSLYTEVIAQNVLSTAVTGLGLL